MDLSARLETIRKAEEAEEIDGKHFSVYVEEVKRIKKSGKYQELENLLKKLIDATEAGDAISHLGVAPWYYEELAKLYRKHKDYRKEVEVLERFASKRHGRGVSPPKLLKRLIRAKQLLSENDNNNNPSS
jgi:hypothetical protein